MSALPAAHPGSAPQFTREISAYVQEHGVTALSHLTCVGDTRDQIDAVLDGLAQAGIRNVLALRGDLPEGMSFPGEEHFRYAAELIAAIRSRGAFCVGAACYPEGHPESPDRDTDLDYLRRKQDAGADFLTTQMVFDNDILYRFLYRALARGIHIPVTAGIMPVVNARQIRRIVKLSNATLPQRFLGHSGPFRRRPGQHGKGWNRLCHRPDYRYGGQRRQPDSSLHHEPAEGGGSDLCQPGPYSAPWMLRRAFCAMRRAISASGARPVGRALAVLEEAYPMAREAARPRSLIRRAPMRAREGVLIIGDALTIPSRDLCRLFAGAREGLALAVTLGAPLDTLVRRLMLTDSALGAAVGACASALVDEVIDGLLREQAADLMQEGLTLSPRFSPGYGDAPLSCQGALLSWLEARRIGISLTAGGLMLPEKSVTALIALRFAEERP